MVKKYIIFSQRCDVHYGAQIHVQTHLQEIAQRSIVGDFVFMTWSKNGLLLDISKELGFHSFSIGFWDSVRLLIFGSLPNLSISHCVIFSHGSIAGYYFSIVRLLNRIKGHVHTLHGTPYSRFKASVVWSKVIPFFNFIERIIYRNSKLIFCNDRDMDDYIKLGVKAKAYQVIKYYREDSNNLIINDRGSVCTFVFVAGFRKQKRHSEFLKFLKENKDILDDIEVKFIGHGPLFKKCKNYVSKNCIKNVHFTGYLSTVEIREVLKSASFGMILSNYEGQPLSVIEYLSFGLPILANDVNGLSELVEGNGILLNANFSYSELRVALIELRDLYYNRQVEYLNLCIASREKFENMFSKDRTLDVFFSKYIS
jgi:glycosyltransferase involved in cell wall biosynthesis